MNDPAIQTFFSDRKEAWLKKNIKASMQDDEVRAMKLECELVFSAAQWLPNAAKRACSRAITTHPSKFSHPSTGIGKKNRKNYTYVSPIICRAERMADGFLRTGNTVGQLDSVGNAAELDVDEFLNLKMQDGVTLQQHIQQDSILAIELLSINSESYQTLKEGFLAMTTSAVINATSSKIKQVYFPVDNDYHQLSLLSNSGLVYELRHRIDKLRFSEKHKTLRELKGNNQYSEEGFAEIYNITTIGYGGTKPQNISVLNNQNGGKAHLLLSVPPQLEKRDIRFPVKDFFIESIRFYDCKDALQKLHGIFKADVDGVIPAQNLRSGRDHRIEEILDAILQRMWALRAVASEQYLEANSQLPQYQKIWLLEPFQQQREQEDAWLDKLCDEIARWIALAYQKTIKKSLTLGPEERDYIKHIIETHGEVLR